MNFNPILISDVGITVLARLGLQRLELSLFKNITESGLREFLAKCTTLKQLSIDTCGCIDEESLDNLRKQYPSVKIVFPSDDEDEDFILGTNGFKGDLPSDDSNNFLYSTDDSNDDVSSTGLSSDVDEDMVNFAGDGARRQQQQPGKQNGAANGHGRANSNGKENISENSNGVSDDEDSSNDEDFNPSDEENEEDDSNESKRADDEEESSIEDGDTEKEEDM